ncbi:MAG: hypothetical protein WCK46_00415 [Candidatus Adlerbacteria bacterium]
MHWQKYILAFVITGAIFGTAFYIAQRIDTQRIADIRATEESISIDILSSETQFELLGHLDCKIIAENPVLSDELNSLASRLSVAEENLGATNKEVINLKEQYSLLEIKDYLLLQQISEKCHSKPVFVLYFYSNRGDCKDCGRMGQELSYLRETYPGLRVYSFDYNLDLSAVKTLIALQKLQGPLPAFIVNNRAPVYGFKTLDEVEKLIPELKTLATSTAATSTKASN